MTDGAGTIGRRSRRANLLGAVILLLAAPSAVWGHNGSGKIRGTCQVSNVSGRATITVRVENLWSESVRNVEPSDLKGSHTGSANLFIQTQPRAIREILPGKGADLEWRGRFYGDGLLDISVEVFAEFPDTHQEGTGIINCNRDSIGNPDGEATPEGGGDATPTPTHGSGGNTPVPQATNTSRPPDTIRPTRTPIESRPTRTPRVDPTRPPTPVPPTKTATAPRPTNTRQPTPTNTKPRPTRTPLLDRPTRTPVIIPTRVPTNTAPPRATATGTVPRPTQTPVPARATRTRAADPTPRATRTPILIPPTATRTPTIGSGPQTGGLFANCSLRRNIDLVTVTMVVENRSGAEIRQVTASPLELEPEGGSLFFDRTGPSPGQVSTLRSGMSATFQWTGRLSAGGTMGFSATASANSPGGVLRTSLIDCGVSGSDATQFDPASFSGTCSLHPGADGQMVFEVRNGSRETLENVEAFFQGRSSTGSAQLLNVDGPAPRNVRTLSPGARRPFAWAGSLLGDGSLTVQFEARGTRATSERISTGRIECTVQLGIAGGGTLPDLGVDVNDQRQSVMIEEREFGADNCAVVEQCVSGTGRRKLLRFNTTTPNYGPGDVFVGDPSNNPRAVFSACHMHYHVQDYADYRLLDLSGNLVARGHKQAFCLVDLWQVPGLGGSRVPKYVDCGFQGISAGWADIYHRGLDCQWIDITGVPSGRYVLEVIVNPAHMIQESDYSNNTARTEVTIP